MREAITQECEQVEINLLVGKQQLDNNYFKAN